MKKVAIALFAILGFMSPLLFSMPTWAAECGGVETSIIDCDNTGAGSIREIILDVVDFMSIGIGILGVIGISVVGIQYLTAGGSEEKTRKAKRRMFEIVLGLGAYAVLWAGLQWLMPGGIFAGEMEATGVSLGASNIEVTVGGVKTLTPVLTPIDADNTSFTWTSSDESVATVSDKGRVTAKSPGSTVITVTTSNGQTASTTVNVIEKSSGGSTAGGGGGDGNGNGDGAPSASGRYRLGTALAGMHAAEDGNINTVKEAVDKKYWGVECDVQYYNGTLMCYHSAYQSTSATFAETVDVCKTGGAKVIIDLKIYETAGLTALGNYIKENNLYNWVVVQTEAQSSMRLLNEVAGRKLEYWGLVMSSWSTLDNFVVNASTYQGLGMTTVNVPLVLGYFRTGTNENIRLLQSVGYDVAVFTWVSFSQSAIDNYDSLGVKYLMTNRLQ